MKPFLRSVCVAITMLVGGVSPAPARALAAASPAPDTSLYPPLSVTNVRTGKPFAMNDLAKSTKPVVIWFWAPT